MELPPKGELLSERARLLRMQDKCGVFGEFRGADAHTYTSAYIYMCIYGKTSLNQPTMGLTLNGAFSEVIGVGS